MICGGGGSGVSMETVPALKNFKGDLQTESLRPIKENKAVWPTHHNRCSKSCCDPLQL